MRKQIMFIHGFLEGSRSELGKKLAKRFRDEYDILAPEVTANPVESIKTINDMIKETTPDVIVGQGLGATYALLCEDKGKPIILVDPVYYPAEYLSEYLDKKMPYMCRRKDGSTEYTLSKEVLAKFSDPKVFGAIQKKKGRMTAIYDDDIPQLFLAIDTVLS